MKDTLYCIHNGIMYYITLIQGQEVGEVGHSVELKDKWEKVLNISRYYLMFLYYTLYIYNLFDILLLLHNIQLVIVYTLIANSTLQ